jgi:hypothetical protein
MNNTELILLLGLMLVVGGAGLAWITIRGPGRERETAGQPKKSTTFLQNQAGQYIYFPWGRYGQGYLLSSQETVARIQRLRGRYTIGILLTIPFLWPLAEAAGSAAGLLLALGLIVIYGLGYIAFVGWTVRGLPRSKDTFQEIMTKQG